MQLQPLLNKVKNLLFTTILLTGLFSLNSIYAQADGANYDLARALELLYGKADNTAVYAPIGKKVPITGDINQLKYFFDALNKAKTDKIRIAHFGDSLIEGDVITAELRENLQKKYGGNGVGFISIKPEDVQMKKTIRQSYSSNWEEASIFTRNPNGWPFGINASVFSPRGNSWVKFEASSFNKSFKSFSEARLFYSDVPSSTTVKYKFGNGSVETAKLSSGSGVQSTTIKAKNSSKTLKIDVNGNSGYFFGVSFENGDGVYVDNFPIKGNSGVSLVDIPKSVLKDFDNQMNYKLIIINFGINVLSPTFADYRWYEKKMIKAVDYFKQAFPNTSILIVSVGDKAIKKGTRFISDPGIPSLLEAQENVAKKTHVAFWNLQEAMGGENSILSWVKAGPPMAFRDYCHLTYEGGTRVAELLYDALMEAKGKVR